MSKFWLSFIIWVCCWFMSFVILELIAVFWKGCPWYTLSTTGDHIERAWWPFQFVFLIGLCVLMVHIFEGGPIKLAVAYTKKALRR